MATALHVAFSVLANASSGAICLASPIATVVTLTVQWGD